MKENFSVVYLNENLWMNSTNAYAEKVWLDFWMDGWKRQRAMFDLDLITLNLLILMDYRWMKKERGKTGTKYHLKNSYSCFKFCMLKISLIRIISAWRF